jgi:hypothetical protein
MALPPNWRSPISAPPGQWQADVNPLALLPSRRDLDRVRLDSQRALLDAGQERHTPIQVNTDGVIWVGNHAVRAAAETGTVVAVLVVDQKLSPAAASIMDLTVG